MKIADVLQSLELAKQSLSQHIQNDLVSYSKEAVSWIGYRHGIFKNQYYPLEYQWLLDNRQYSYLLSNGAFLQFYYCFDDEGLLSGRAALYPRPIPSNCTEEEIWEAAESIQDMDGHFSEYLLNVVEEIEMTGTIPPNTSHIRFDYDRKVTSHEPAHLQFGGINDIRIPSDFFPTPHAFIELISDAFSGLKFNISNQARAHSANKALRNLACERIINLSHAKP